MKSLYILLSFIFLINIGCNAAPTKILEPTQNVTAISILNTIYGITIDPSTYEICDGTNFTCSLSGQYYTVISINLSSNKNNMTQSFSSFKDITSIKILGTTQLPTIFFNELNLLTKLSKIDIQYQNTPIPETAVLPVSLKTVIFYQMSVPITKNFFEYGITGLTISQTVSGFSYPTTLTTTNSNMNTLSIRIESYANLPSNMGTQLTGVISLTLYINNIVTSPYTITTFPSLTQFNELMYLTVIFDQTSGSNSGLFDISTSSIYQLTSSLQSLQIFYSGLSIDSQGFSDFSNFKPGFSLILRATDSLLSTCTNNDCLKMPANSSLEISESVIDFSNINFSNLVSFENFLNTKSQTLPKSGLDNIYSLKIYNSGVYGDVPEIYCSIQTVVINNNQLNGTLPACISTCLTTTERYEKILPNSFTNFTISTPISCPGFAIDTIPAQLMNTDGSSKLVITGTNLGWNLDAGFGNLFNFVIPNSKVEIKFGQGVGLLIPQTITFHSNYKFFYNVSYIAPTIDSFTINLVSGVKYLSICGTGFDYTNKNQITFTNINKTFAFDNAVQGCTQYSSNVDLSATFATNGLFTVEMIVGGQKSNSISFDITQPSTTTTTTSATTSTSSPTTTTSSSTSGTNNNSDNESETPSSSSKLIVPLYVFIFLTFLSSFLLF